MQAAGSSKVLSLQQLLTAPITRMFPRFLWTRQNLSVSGLGLSCRLFDRLQGATVPMKLPVQVHVVVQPAGWDAAQYVLSRAPQQQLPVTHSSSSVPEAVGAPGTGLEEVPAAALPTAAAGPDSNPLGPFLAYASRSKSGKLYRWKFSTIASWTPTGLSAAVQAHTVFEQVCACLCTTLT
jgi:hypothetical protein